MTFFRMQSLFLRGAKYFRPSFSTTYEIPPAHVIQYFGRGRCLDHFFGGNARLLLPLRNRIKPPNRGMTARQDRVGAPKLMEYRLLRGRFNDTKDVWSTRLDPTVEITTMRL